jgi:hypothetical protein
MTQPGAPAGPVTEKHVRPRAILVMVPWLPTTQAARRVWAAPRRMVVAETVEAKLNEVGGDLTSSAPRPNFLHLGLSLSLASMNDDLGRDRPAALRPWEGVRRRLALSSNIPKRRRVERRCRASGCGWHGGSLGQMRRRTADGRARHRKQRRRGWESLALALTHRGRIFSRCLLNGGTLVA